ncbi:MAG: 16S rRNA (adenine(1518)-N(6)/adenine(1519)-N(6))-dimethyltransferase RsmA [Acidimicrobiia bacterium]|nr:16S rRNA (adenine(1518)-N(6)/adenine(1519)-N(6))-dimethyltransferase RsmA [Acidimicrobiia bacterium]
MPQGRNEIRALLEAHGVRPRRSLGQNFLADPNLVDRIVRTAGPGPGDRIVEVGAGTGTLTRGLAATGADVLAFEVDRRLLPVLEETLSGTDVDLRGDDVTKVDLGAVLGEGPWTMVANLPYNVGTPLVLEVLRDVPAVVRLVVMVQREVADRFVAGPGSRTYGVPSVVVALHADTELAFTVPPSVFYPVPEVESAVVTMSRIDPPEHVDSAIQLAGVAFRQRRKMLRRSLSSVVADAGAVLAAAGIDATARPEDLPPNAFVRLAEAMP